MRSEEEGCRVTAGVFTWTGRSKEEYRSTAYALLSLIHALSTDGTDKHPGVQTCDLLPSPLLFSHRGDHDLGLLSLLPCPPTLLSALLHPNEYNEMERETCTEDPGGGKPVPLAPINRRGGSGPAAGC